MNGLVRRVLVVFGIALATLVIVVGGYVAYLSITYSRIPDGESVEVANNVDGTTVAVGKDYTVLTYNIGFGAYTPDYTFFMDEGIMKDGTKTVGKHSVASSKESVLACTDGAIDVIVQADPDFVLAQEVDVDSTRSYGVNQREAICSAFGDKGVAFATNFHSAFLAYPFSEPHGIVNAGLLSLSGTHVDSAVRRTYPIDEKFPTKFFDLDRCFLVERLPVDNGKELVLVNSHMSAYDEGGVIRAAQMKLLMGVLEQEYAQGDYVIAGGDWNHALCGSELLYRSMQDTPPWLATFDESFLPRGFSVVRPTNLAEVATCRGADIAYEPGVSYQVTIDGFIVSDNVKASATNIDTGYAYSDHNPVELTFSLVK